MNQARAKAPKTNPKAGLKPGETATQGTKPSGKSASKKAKKPQKQQARKATVTKQCMALDVSKDEIQICFRELLSDGTMRIKTQKKVNNTLSGWKTIDAEIKKHCKSDAPNGLVVIMEATGVYHENVCQYLHKQGYTMHVVLPNKSRNYAKSLGTKSKNDKIDAAVLAQMGLERTLEAWIAPSDNMLKIKHLSRERQALIEDATATKNQLHALTNGYRPEKETEKRFDVRLKLIAKQVGEIEKQLIQAVQADADLNVKLERITTIKGFGTVSAIVLLAETNGFVGFENRAQLTSYAGYDVVENQSGKHTGKTRISKRGNSRIRGTLQFPSLVAIRYNPMMKQLYERVYDRTKIKMKGVVAVQRKMLLLAFALCKNETDFDPNFQQNNTENNAESTSENTQKTEVQQSINKNVDTAKDDTYPA